MQNTGEQTRDDSQDRAIYALAVRDPMIIRMRAAIAAINVILPTTILCMNVKSAMLVCLAEAFHHYSFNRELPGWKKAERAQAAYVEQNWPRLKEEWPVPSMDTFPKPLDRALTLAAIETAAQRTIWQPVHSLYKASLSRLRRNTAPAP